MVGKNYELLVVFLSLSLSLPIDLNSRPLETNIPAIADATIERYNAICNVNAIIKEIANAMAPAASQFLIGREERFMLSHLSFEIHHPVYICYIKMICMLICISAAPTL
jgi:hypothetical protein